MPTSMSADRPQPTRAEFVDAANCQAVRPPVDVSPGRTSQPRPVRHRHAALRWRERGQATAEYALVMLAAAALAGLLLAWASGTDGIGRLLDAVMDSLVGEAAPEE